MKVGVNQRCSPRSGTTRGKGEKGYVLVLLILMVALIFVSLSTIVPKIFFEAQRDREEELYFRGMQYQRAIQLFFRKFGRYPNSLDELEKTNGVRFLRKRYTDPITKKKEWRLIHVGPNGQFVDAKTTVTVPTGPGQPAGANSTQPNTTTGNQPGQTGFGSGQPGSQGTGFGLSPSTSTFGNPGSNPAGQPGSSQPGAGNGNPSNDPALTASANPAANPQQIRSGNVGQTTNTGDPNAPGGTNSNTPSSNTPSSQSSSNPSVFGGGPIGGGPIAGVASLSEDTSIRKIKDYTEYDKWEFIYDYRSDPVAMAKVGGVGAATGVGGVGGPNVPGTGFTGGPGGIGGSGSGNTGGPGGIGAGGPGFTGGPGGFGGSGPGGTGGNNPTGVPPGIMPTPSTPSR